MNTLILSDTHCGSAYGLTPPRWQMPKNRGLQRPFWDWFVEKTEKHGPYDLVLFLGDATEGIGKKWNIDIETNDTGMQGKMAIEILHSIPITDQASFEFCYGTPAHGTTYNKHELPIAEEFGAVPRKTHRLLVDGVRINAEHTGRSSTAPTGQGSQAATPAVKDEIKAQRAGAESAQIYYRAHVHYYFLTSWCSQKGFVRAYNLPCLKYPLDDFAIRLDPMMYNMGFLVHKFEDGEIVKEVVEIFDWESRRKVWKYKTI